jgi:hypothetical protein
MRPFWKITGGWTVGISLFFYQGAAATEWSLEPAMSLKGQYEDNPTFIAEHHPAAGVTLSPGLKFDAQTERLDLQGSLLLNVTRYPTERSLDRTDQYYTVSGLYSAERNRWGLQGSYTQDQTLATELTQTGKVLAWSRRDFYTLNPKWIRTLTEKVTLQADYTFSAAHYFDPGLTSYQNQQGTVQMETKLSERDQSTLSAYYTSYRALKVVSRSFEYGARIGLTHRFSETFHADLNVGTRNTTSKIETDLYEFHDRERGWVGDLKMEKEFETVLVRGGFTRETEPSGSGYVILVNHPYFFVRKTMTTTLSASLALDLYLDHPVLTGGRIPDSRYFRVEQRWDWQWTERWSLGASYIYQEQKEYNTQNNLFSNTVYLITTYTGQKVAISR